MVSTKRLLPVMLLALSLTGCGLKNGRYCKTNGATCVTITGGLTGAKHAVFVLRSDVLSVDLKKGPSGGYEPVREPSYVPPIWRQVNPNRPSLSVFETGSGSLSMVGTGYYGIVAGDYRKQ